MGYKDGATGQLFCILVKYQIYCTQIILTTAIWLLQLCSDCAAVASLSHHRIVPAFLFSPVHHFHEELHQLLLVLQVAVSSQVLVCLLVLPIPPHAWHIQFEGLYFL